VRPEVTRPVYGSYELDMSRIYWAAGKKNSNRKKDAVMAGFASGKVRVQCTIDPESRKASDDGNGTAAIQRHYRAGSAIDVYFEGAGRFRRHGAKIPACIGGFLWHAHLLAEGKICPNY